MPKLVIVESPTKAKTLAKFLDKSYTIEASMGHIRDLPKKGLGVNVENNFEPEYEIPQKSKKTVTQLKKYLKDADEIILATDPDREGEAIAWHLKHILSSTKEGKKKNYERVVFHELTKEAVLDAFNHAGKLNVNLVDSQQARRVLDRLVGYKLSPLLWKKVRYGLSAGRVQSVAVRLVVERERERLAFIPEEYWNIDVDLVSAKDKKKEFTAALEKKDGKKLEVKDEKTANIVQSDLEKAKYTVLAIEKSERKKNPYAPFKTSTLQQAMANVYGISASRTMRAAQQLFEEGLITYHRTDSLTLSADFIKICRSYIKEIFGNEFLPSEALSYKTKSKGAQEAHEAIRPTDLKIQPGSDATKKLQADAKKVYKLVWMRSIECQMMPAIYDQTKILVETDNGYGLKANGSIIKFEGWLILGKEIGDEDDEKLAVLPDLEIGESLHMKKIHPSQHFTQPPARYSDATLIKQLEEMEIGRPSTYAPTLSTIKQRGYVDKEGRYYKPTDFAFVVTDLLVEHFPNVVDYEFTAGMEEEFDKIAAGEKEWVPVIKEFYEPFEKTVTEKDKTLEKREVTTLETTEEKCPECGSVLLVKLGKYGKFLSCSNYPDCEYARPLAEELGEGDAESAESQYFGDCDVCEDGKMMLKQGRFGKFLACSNYPKCKNTKSYLEKIGMKCPKCSDGEVIVKKAKGRTFYGCSNYPDCDYAAWKNPLIDSSEESREDE